MPLKNGKLTPKERAFSGYMARTDDKTYAATRANLSYPQQAAQKMMEKPAVRAEIMRQQEDMLYSEILPLALQVHKKILADDKTPAGARVQAVKLAYDRTLGANDGGQTKEPHEMTPEEIAQAIGKLEDAAAAKARPVHRQVTIEQPKADVFE